MRFHLDQRYVIAASCALALALSVVLAVAAYEIVGDPLAELSQSHDERAEHVAEIEVLGTSETVDAALGIKNETSNVIAQQNNGVAPATTAVTAPDEADDNPDTTSAGNIDDASGAAPLAFVASTAEIGGRVWIDRNGNGIQDPQEESDPSGVIVRLLDENRFFEDITTTDGAGEYSFVVEPGKYILFFDIEQESISPRFATFDKSLDSDVSPATFFQEPGDPVGILGGLSDSVDVLAGDVVTTKDAGVIPIFTSVAIETSTNNADSDTAPGEELEVNETVTFTYTVTNTGNVRLIDIAVADDVIGPIECLTNTLGVGQSLTCTATTKVTEGPYVNLGSVSATPIDSVDIALRPVGARDISHHVGVVPFMASASVSLETATNGEDDASPGPQLTVGDDVTFTYTATNTGMTDLINVNVSDKILGDICTIALLTPGESESCPPVTSTVTEGAYRSVGNVSATPVDEQANPFDTPVIASDTSFHLGIVDVSQEKLYPCPTVVDGPVMQRNNDGVVEWDSGLTAAPGSQIEITTSEPGTSPGQPNEQLYVLVGGEQFGPTPGEHTTSSFTVTTGGPVVVVHYSVLNSDSFSSNSVKFSLCGTDLTRTR